MGGCASSPKVLKHDTDKVPEPSPATAPATEKSSEVIEGGNISGEAREIEVVKIEEVTKIVGGDEIEKVNVEDSRVNEIEDEQSNRRRSLSLLFKENEDGKQSTETHKTIEAIETSVQEPEKQKEETKTENPSLDSTTNIQETQNVENPVEEIPNPVTITPEKVETLTQTVDIPASDTKKPVEVEEKNEKEEVSVKDEKVVTQSLNDDTRTEELALAVSSSAPVATPAGETQKPENSEEKKSEEPKEVSIKSVEVKGH